MSDNPDGTAQTPAPPAAPPANPSPAPDGGGEEPLRNKHDLDRAVRQRQEARTEVAALKIELQGHRARVASAAQVEADKELDGLRAFKAEREAQDEQRAHLDRRSKVREKILEGAHPTHKDTLGLMLTGLHEAGDINLDHDNPDQAGAEARDKLSKRFPAYFQAPDGVEQAGQPGHPGIDLTGVKFPTDLSPEQMAKLSPEQFQELFMATPDIDTGA